MMPAIMTAPAANSGHAPACPFPHERIGKALLIQGDLFEVLPWLQAHAAISRAGAPADLLITDPPYGCTDCYWDKKIDLAAFWALVMPMCKKNAAYALFCQMPFAAALYESNRKFFRYDLIYQKRKAGGFLNCNKMPLRGHELIYVFYEKLPVYNPQKRPGKPYHRAGGRVKDNSCYQGKLKLDSANGGSRYPVSILPQGNMSGGIDLLGCYGAPRIPGSSPDGSRHPSSILSLPFDRELLGGACATAAKEPGLAHNTQKNVHALAFLIRSYSNEGELVLDPMMGSGSTGVAALRCGRAFIGVEKERSFFDAACGRLRRAQNMGCDLMAAPADQ